MPPTPEDEAREKIDLLLQKAGWQVQDAKAANIHAARGVAIREFPLESGYGFADYLLYVDSKAAGVIEAKRIGATLSGVEIQSAKYSEGLAQTLPAWRRPLPFLYESTGIETHFTNGCDPIPRARNTFAFHQPDTLARWITPTTTGTTAAEPRPAYSPPPPTSLRAGVQQMPNLIEDGLWPAQIRAINNLEISMAEDRSRALIQMATGSGKTFTAINFIYRLIKFGGARRVLFLVDRGNLGDQTYREFQQFVSPYNNFKFTEEYIVQRLSSNILDHTARVCICTIQRLYSMLKGRELAEEDDEVSAAGLERVFKDPDPIEYNPAIPIETFDIIVTDECHRSIYNLWAQVLEYFDAHLIGLTATPGRQTFGFFNQNLVMEYPHEQAVADGVNVNYDVYRIRTAINDAGSHIEAGFYVQKQERDTRAVRWEQLDDDFDYDPNKLDRSVVAPDQIRTVIRTFREKLFTEIFPGRSEAPKTLIFAKDDNHAENIVGIVREEFCKGNEFAQKITYRTTGANPKDLIQAFRNSFNPRVAVTVDMIATGTDIKPVEIVLFMRAVKSRGFFEQMKGRGVRVIDKNALAAVTPDAQVKDHFVIVDAVGVCEQDKTDARPMERKPSVSLEKLFQAVAFGNIEEEVLTSIAGRLARMEHRLSTDDREKIKQTTGGLTLQDLSRRLVTALDPDNHMERAKADNHTDTPTEEQITAARTTMAVEAVRPLCDPKARELVLDIKRKNEITIDCISQDQVIEAGFSEEALDRARGMVASFEQFIQDNKDEITALQILYSRPYKQRLRFEDVQSLAERIQAPPHLLSESQLWQAYAALEKDKVRGAAGRRILTDLVSLVRFAMQQENELIPFPERVKANFKVWLAQQEKDGKEFTEEQRHWLTMIRDHIAANLSIETDDFEYAPFAREGGLGKVYQVFGEEFNLIIEALNLTFRSFKNAIIFFSTR